MSWPVSWHVLFICSKKLELVGSKQDVMSGKVDGIGKELAGQGATLERLQATCSELVQVSDGVGFGWV